MKSIRYGTLLALLAVAGACNLTEEIYLEPDGSGSIALSFDGSGMLEMAGGGLLDSTSGAMDSTPTPPIPGGWTAALERAPRM